MTLPCFIFDIDGTIADGSHREHLITRHTPKRWDDYFDLAYRDRPVPHMQRIVRELAKTYTIAYVTGRVERLRDMTVAWLQEHQFPTGYLYMRGDGDHRNDDILKAEILAEIRRDNLEPVMAFEDRTRIVKMWRENGIPCAQVRDGDF